LLAASQAHQPRAARTGNRLETEKPGKPPQPNGIDSKGQKLDPAVPTKVYAAKPETKSRRPKETVSAVSELGDRRLARSTRPPW
jgi:hypothetical protein